jgi:hypothetical protein
MPSSDPTARSLADLPRDERELRRRELKRQLDAELLPHLQAQPAGRAVGEQEVRATDSGRYVSRQLSNGMIRIDVAPWAGRIGTKPIVIGRRAPRHVAGRSRRAAGVSRDGPDSDEPEPAPAGSTISSRAQARRFVAEAAARLAELGGAA